MMTDSRGPTPRPKGSNRHRIIGHWALVGGAIAVAFVLRLSAIGRYVTPDEPAWVYRAIRFADAVTGQNWAAVPSTGHPGVTTMWLGAAGVAVQRLVDPAASAIHLDWIRRLAWLAPENGTALKHLGFFLPGGRVAVALVTTLGLAALYALLVRLFGRGVALLSVGLLAFDPFLIGHSGLLHTDALLATFILLALATALCAMREPRRAVWPALSGIFTGLALLTKSPALILVPFILLLLTVAALRRGSSMGHRSLVVVHCSLFILFTAVTGLALYPALWANPANTLGTLSAFAGRHIEMAQRPIFFAGRMTYDPGPAFYPVVFILRVSPVVLVGFVAGLVTLRRLPPDRRLAFVLLVVFAIGFGALMSQGAKKHDRYLLPAFPPLTLAAALGWAYLSERAASGRVDGYANSSAGVSSTRFSIAPILLPLLQLLLVLPFMPWPLTAFNLLAGGPWTAARVLAVGWGEGMGSAARWLNGLPEADQLTVAAASVPSFAPLFDGHTISLDQASLADYIVLGADQSTHQPTDQPAHTVRLGFLSQAVVVTNTVPSEQAAYLAARAEPDDPIVLDADAPLRRSYTGPGTLTCLAGLPDQADVVARLRELSAGRSHLWLVADPAASPITAEYLRRGLTAIATPVHTASIASTTITQYAIRNTPHITPGTLHVNFGDQLTLIDAMVPAAPVSMSFPVFLRWQVPAPTGTELHASLTLKDKAGHRWAEVGQLVLNAVDFPTSAWVPGEWADSTLKLKIPERIPPDTYTVQLTVADGQGAQLGAWDAGGQFQGVRVPLADVEIAPPPEPAGPAPCLRGHTVTAGPLQVCIAELLPQVVRSGDVLTMALIWHATAVPKADYRVRWRLLTSEGVAAVEQESNVCPYPTSRWRAGDSFEARYDVRLDPALSAGRYRLTLNILSQLGEPLWPEERTLGTVEVLPRDRSFELPASITHPLNLRLGDTVHLRGFDLALPGVEEGTGEGALQPGDTVSLTLYWQADGPTDVDYTVFVHLLGPDGRPHGQVDRVPGGGSAEGEAPTTSWAPGQVVVDTLAVPVAVDAPAGIYHVAIGMYDAASGGRLPVSDDSGHFLPNDQAILPVEITVSGGSG